MYNWGGKINISIFALLTYKKYEDMKRNVLFFVVVLIASLTLVSCGSNEEPQPRYYDYTIDYGGSNVSFRGEEKDCPKCYVPGSCPVCQGRGYFVAMGSGERRACNTCGGTGLCPKCGGSGKIK